MSLSNEERETIINFNEAEELASIEVPVGTRLYRRLNALGLQPTDERVYQGKVEFLCFEVPKKWVKLNPPPVREYTEEQREAQSMRIKKMHQMLKEKKADKVG